MWSPFLFSIAQGSGGWLDAPRIGAAASGGAADPAEMMENAGLVVPKRGQQPSRQQSKDGHIDGTSGTGAPVRPSE